MKRTLLIVDDEINIRIGLQKMIERKFQDKYSIVLAANGELALDIMTTMPIDIMITDIRMPVMDGIVLINRLQEAEHKPSIIILSGHDDFQYAQEAIRCEVKVYLLKPIVREELYRALIRLEQDLWRKEDIEYKLFASKQQLRDYQSSQLNYIFLHRDMEKAEIEEKLQVIQLEVFDPGYFIVVVKATEAGRPVKKDVASFHNEAILGGVGEEAYNRVIRFFDVHGNLVILTDHRDYGRLLFAQNAEQLHYVFSVGISERTTGIIHLKEAYCQAAQALKYTFLKSHPSYIEFVSIKDKDAVFSIPTESIRKMANMLGTDRDKEMKNILIEILDFKSVSHYDISYIERISESLNELVFDHVFTQYGEESIDILKLYKRVGNIYNFSHFYDYFHSVESLLQRLNAYIETMKSVYIDHKEMKRAIRYIQENYQTDLDMAVVSNHVSFNYSYFSQAFKEFTGVSFVYYLKKIRMDKAKELLETTELKVYEIGERIGLENTKHFNRVFREMEGITPMEYRTQIQIPRLRGNE
jgi:two-component system response regulator YesN